MRCSGWFEVGSSIYCSNVGACFWRFCARWCTKRGFDCNVMPVNTFVDDVGGRVRKNAPQTCCRECSCAPPRLASTLLPPPLCTLPLIVFVVPGIEAAVPAIRAAGPPWKFHAAGRGGALQCGRQHARTEPEGGGILQLYFLDRINLLRLVFRCC